LNTKSDNSSDIKVDLVEQDIPKLSYFDPSDAHDTNIKGKYASLVFHLDTVVMKNANDLNQSNKDSFYSKASSHQQGFDKIKKVIGTEVLLCFPDFKKLVLFHLYTDASDHRMGAIIMQDKKPIAFYSKKIKAAQKRYTTTGRELLSAIETCKEYKNILLGYHAPIIVFTDHKNNTFNSLNASGRVLRWLLLLEEYGVTFDYFPGKKNVVADALSQLDIDSLKIQEEEVLTLLPGSENNSISNIK
jgi:hypothetical protein